MKTETIVKVAVVAALYVVLTISIAPIAYRDIQFRISEILVLLCFYRRDYIYSLIIGCFIANFFSPIPMDIFFGTLHTAISVFLISRIKNLFIASLIPTLLMPIIAFELYLFLELPFWISLLTTMISEFIVLSIIGYSIFKILEKNSGFMELIGAEERKYNDV